MANRRGVGCNLGEDNFFRFNLSSEDKLKATIKKALAQCQEVMNEHDQAAGRRCECLLCEELAGGQWAIGNLEAAVGGLLHGKLSKRKKERIVQNVVNNGGSVKITNNNY